MTPTEKRPRPECWVFLSENLPPPLRGRHRCVGEASDVAGTLQGAITYSHLIALRFVVGDQDLSVYVNPAHIVAVMP